MKKDKYAPIVEELLRLCALPLPRWDYPWKRGPFSNKELGSFQTGLVEAHYSDEAEYCQEEDLIHLPSAASAAPTVRASLLFHELTHSTLHPTRLDRKWREKAGGYVREEFVAELGAALLDFDAGLQGELERHAQYLQYWAEGRTLPIPQQIEEVYPDTEKAVEYVLAHLVLTPREIVEYFRQEAER